MGTRCDAGSGNGSTPGTMDGSGIGTTRRRGVSFLLVLSFSMVSVDGNSTA